MRSLTETASAMFLEQGYEAVSLDTLIARVGGSRRNIYSNFGGKEGLFVEVVKHLCAELAEPLWKLNIPEHNMHEALSLFAKHLLDVVLQPRALALHRLMIAEGHRFPQVAQAIHAAGHAQRRPLHESTD